MASETLRASGASALGLTATTTTRVGGGSTAFSALGDDLPNLPHFRKNKQVARPLLHNFSGANGTVYEKHWKPAEVDHLGGLVHRAEAIRGISTAEKEAIALRKAQAAAARAGSSSYQSNLTEIPVDVQTEKQVRLGQAAAQRHVACDMHGNCTTCRRRRRCCVLSRSTRKQCQRAGRRLSVCAR